MKPVNLALASLLTLLSQATSQAEGIRIVAAQRGNWETSIPELGRDAGIFAKYNVEPEITYTQGTGETLQVVVAGSADLGLSIGILGAMGAYNRGAPLRVVAATSTGLQEAFYYVRADSNIKSLKDATDRTIAFATNGSSTQIAALSIINQYGVKARPVATGDANSTFTQVMSGQVDIGWSTAPLHLDAADRGEIRIIANASEVPRLKGETSRVVVANASRLDAKRDVINRYLKGFRETIEWLYSDPEALQKYEAISGISPKTTQRMIKDFIPKDSLQSAEVKGLELLNADAVSFKFIPGPLSAQQLSELIQIQPGAK
jgi:NitT/TauT family transport system substrate-binding protein